MNINQYPSASTIFIHFQHQSEATIQHFHNNHQKTIETICLKKNDTYINTETNTSTIINIFLKHRNAKKKNYHIRSYKSHINQTYIFRIETLRRALQLRVGAGWLARRGAARHGAGETHGASVMGKGWENVWENVE